MITQRVRYGTTRTGQPGLFTHGFLAWPLDPARHEKWLAMTPEQRVSYCASLGFRLEGV